MPKIIVKNATTGNELLRRSVRIRKSLDEIRRTLELEIPPPERAEVKRRNRLQAVCKNSLDDGCGGKRCAATVLVDEAAESADISKHSITAIGRPPARDIIDSVRPGGGDPFFEVNNTDRTLKTIVREIASKFNITCGTFDYEGVDDPTGVVSSFKFENESPWTKLINEAGNQGYILTSNEIGNLNIWEAGGGNREEPFHVTEGINIKNIKWTENGSEQFHEYIAKGGGGEARAIDNTCPGNRALTVSITTDPLIDGEALKNTLERRALTEMRRRRESKVTAAAPGWGLAGGQIISLGGTYKLEIYWIPNILTPVKAPSLGLDAKLLISEAEYTADAETMSCDLTPAERGAHS